MASKRKMTAEDRETIFDLFRRGVGPRMIARTLGRDSQTIRKVIEEEKAKEPTLEEIDPLKFLQDQDLMLEGIIEEAAMVGPRGNRAEQLMALRIKARAIQCRHEVARDVGVLPFDLGRLGREIEWREVHRCLDEVFDLHDFSAEVRGDMEKALAGTLGSELEEQEFEDEAERDLAEMERKDRNQKGKRKS